MMKTVFTMLVTVAAVAIVFQPAVAGLSMSANFNPGEASRILIPANPRGGIGTGILKMKFTSAAGSAFLNFCVGPADDPCGTLASFVVSLGPGQQSFAVVDGSEFLTATYCRSAREPANR